MFRLEITTRTPKFGRSRREELLAIEDVLRSVLSQLGAASPGTPGGASVVAVQDGMGNVIGKYEFFGESLYATNRRRPGTQPDPRNAIVFRAEVRIIGDTPRQQRVAIAGTLREMTDRVELDNDPLAGSSRITITTEGQLAGEAWFEIGLGRLVA
jgi:hypothetical protein